MGSVRRLYERFRQLIHEGAKFGIIGLIGLVVNNLVYGWTHIGLGLGVVTASTIAFVVTAVMSYIGNRYWSFRHRERTTVHRETALFLVLNGIGLLIQDAVVGIVHHQGAVVGFVHNGLGLTNNEASFVALNLGIVLGTLFRFWSYRKWVWAEPQTADGDHEKLEPALAAAPGTASGTGDEAGSPH